MSATGGTATVDETSIEARARAQVAARVSVMSGAADDATRAFVAGCRCLGEGLRVATVRQTALFSISCTTSSYEEAAVYQGGFFVSMRGTSPVRARVITRDRDRSRVLDGGGSNAVAEEGRLTIVDVMCTPHTPQGRRSTRSSGPLFWPALRLREFPSAAPSYAPTSFALKSRFCETVRSAAVQVRPPRLCMWL